MRIKTFLVIATVLLASSAFAQVSGAQADPHLAKAIELRGQAKSAYDSGDYDTAASLAKQAEAELGLVSGKIGHAPVAEKPGSGPVAASVAGQANALPLPAEYIVRLIPERRDCLWRIAEYPFVYGDPLKWSLLYEANKKTFRDPANPDLIFPGQELQIPSLGGETREGTFDSTKQYESMPK
jgi:nucleoid-associated protein YgaU